MLKRFSVKNFKNFNEKLIFELGCPANYEFNRMIIKNNCVSKAIIYGINGSGKSNLALAIFDIILHLTDKERAIDKYYPYLNLKSGNETAEFEFDFSFEGVDVCYKYGKTAPLDLTYETLIIDGAEVLSYDFVHQKGEVNLEGTGTLNLTFSDAVGMEKMSRVKYVKSNAALLDNPANRAFKAFTSFVDRMLMFYSLTENRYQGFNVGSESLTEGIIKAGRLKEFEKFLHSQGLEYELIALDLDGKQEIFCKYPGNRMVPFLSLASTGTQSLTLFYYWYIRMSEASLVFMDEYDAFYHFELSQEIVKLVKEMENTQVILSTHNTDLMSNDLLRPDAYYRLKDNRIQSFDKITSKELRKAHNIQKMYKAGVFDE